LQVLQEAFRSELEIGTMQTCWHGLRDETQSTSEVRQTFCKDLEELINTILTNIKEDKRNRSILVEKGTKLVTDLAKTEEVMKKARAKYVDARKKQDRSLEAVQKAKTSGSSITKFQKASEKDEKRADKTDQEYRQSVNNLKIAQDRFYDTDMPVLLREFEQHEEKRLQMTREYFNTLVEKQSPIGPHWVDSNERFLTKVREINIRTDLDLYVEKHRPDSNQPPPRAQYISYDGSIIQEVNGTMSTTDNNPPVTTTKKPKKAKLPLLPGKKKKEVPDKPKTESSNHAISSPTVNTHVNTTITSPPAGGIPHPPSADHHHNGDDRPAGTAAVFNPPKQLVTIYKYEATEDNEISFAEGETIYLLEKDDSGWWRGRNGKGQEGLFPSNFVEVVGEEANSGSIEINKDFQALYDYEAEDETELTIKEGEILHVISETDGWYFGTSAQGKEGNFPSNFVEPVNTQKRE